MARVYWTAAMVAGAALATMAGALRFNGPGAAAVQVAVLFALAGGLAVCVLVVTRKTQWDTVPEVTPILAVAGWESDRAFNSPDGELIDVDSLPVGPSATSPGTMYRAHKPEDCVLCATHRPGVRLPVVVVQVEVASEVLTTAACEPVQVAPHAPLAVESTQPITWVEVGANHPYEFLNVDQLRAACRKLGLKVSGRKVDLRERLDATIRVKATA